jgi:hypothetical protein
MRPVFPISLQIRACCSCTTKCLECRDSQLRKDHRLPIDWPSRFFRRASRPKEEESEVPALPAEKPAPAMTGA